MARDDDTAALRPRRPSLGPETQGIRRGGLVGDWRVERYLGHGGCGTVYECFHEPDGRRAALKVLHAELADSAEMIERFVREVRAASVIRHPGIVEIYDSGRLPEGRPYYVMELLEGRGLDDLLAAQPERRFAPAEVVALLDPVCGALAAAHAAGVVHRDVKAANVFVVEQGEGARAVKLLDFGIAKLVRPDTTTTFVTLNAQPGTPTAMAPEQILGGRVDARTDVYALGVLAFQLLTGRLPFDALEAFEIERMHVQDAPPRASRYAPGVPAAVDVELDRAMAKTPAARHAGAAEFFQAFRGACAGS
jgi:serine/threonine-protein kinase